MGSSELSKSGWRAPKSRKWVLLGGGAQEYIEKCTRHKTRGGNRKYQSKLTLFTHFKYKNPLSHHTKRIKFKTEKLYHGGTRSRNVSFYLSLAGTDLSLARSGNNFKINLQMIILTKGCTQTTKIPNKNHTSSFQRCKCS